MAKNRTIKLKLYENIINEYPAGGVITPGMLLTLASTGKVIAHNVLGGGGSKMFALEDELQGRTIDVNFAVDERVQCAVVTPGSEVLAILAVSQNVAIGATLVSNGAGLLRAATPDSSSVVIEQTHIAIALEALVTNSTVTGRIAVRIL